MHVGLREGCISLMQIDLESIILVAIPHLCALCANYERGHLLSRRTEYSCTQRAVEHPGGLSQRIFWGMMAIVMLFLRGDFIFPCKSSLLWLYSIIITITCLYYFSKCIFLS